MKVYVVRDNNRDYDYGDLRVFTRKNDADLECIKMINADLASCQSVNKKLILDEFAKAFFEANEQHDDIMSALDIAVCDVLGGRCFVTEVEVEE